MGRGIVVSDFDIHVRKLVAWHFDPNTGSPFWLGKRTELGFDPIRDVQGAADLAMFPDVGAALRSVPAQELIPAGLSGKVFRVYESGGTTGAPKRIVDGDCRARMLEWARLRLIELGVPPSGNWLHLGPTGPHVAGTDVARHAAIGRGLFYAVDFDPRWVKNLLARGSAEVAEEYLQHLLDQGRTVLETQDISVLNATPPLLEAICSRPELYELVRAKVKAILWAGTSISPENLRQLDEVFFPDAVVAGVYGNSLMGVAPQRRRLDTDTHRCVFEPFPETTRLELVDEEGRQVGYGQRGRVRLHLLSEEMFLPNILERDSAVRVEPAPGGEVDGLADVQTYGELEDAQIIEGVY
ncbi:phenazine biosynthesis protein [Amycolatopsis anabasis]|uniref:phenazine biosynthesis protein n=1 Tax=Amycolatopsis anabasis TaxID=1840409 RepID=UPI001C555A8D|nr:phenazine biosynthesis protein [Amycolatopsis anabasis]